SLGTHRTTTVDSARKRHTETRDQGRGSERYFDTGYSFAFTLMRTALNDGCGAVSHLVQLQFLLFDAVGIVFHPKRSYHSIGNTVIGEDIRLSTRNQPPRPISILTS